MRDRDIGQKQLANLGRVAEPNLVTRRQFEVDLPEDRGPFVGLGDVLEAYPAQAEEPTPPTNETRSLGRTLGEALPLESDDVRRIRAAKL
jgi:hypothetical protein